MEKRRLASDVVSLIHHIKLNEVGWWESSLRRMILIILWLANEDLTVDEIRSYIKKELILNAALSDISIQVQELIREGKINAVHGNKYTISDIVKKELQDITYRTELLHENVKVKFIKKTQTYDTSVDPNELWEKINEGLIIPSVKEMGSRLYQLIVGENPDIEQMYGFSKFLEQFPSEKQRIIKEIVISFLSSSDKEIHNYILSFLRAYFILESGKLGKDTITSLYHSMKEPPSLTIYVDTNFLFSILGIHNNPSDEDAELLLQLLSDLKGVFQEKLLVLPITLEETRKAIQWRVDRAADIIIGKNLANVTYKRRDLSGFLAKLSKEVKKSGQKLSLKEFYGPYITNLLDIVRSKGVELYNCDLKKYDSDDDVQSDIADQCEFEKSHYGENAKKYDAIKHDMFLWHFVYENRPPVNESPLDAKYWIVTVDFHLLRFDQYKRNRLNERYPVTLHPSTIIQMLQFWIPRTNEFEETIYRSWLSPLFYEDFDTKSENITLKIIETLSRYENIDDLPPEVVRNIILDDVMRQRLSEGVEKTDEEIRQFIDETIIRQTRRLADQVKNQKQQSESKDEVIKAQEIDLNGKKKEILEKNSEIQKLEEKLKEKDEEIKNVKGQINEIDNRNKQRVFIFKWLYLPIIIISLLLIGSIILISILTNYNIPILISTFWILIYLLVSSSILNRKLVTSVYDTKRIITSYKEARKWLIGVLLVSIAVEVVASIGVSEYQSIIKLFTNNNK